MDNIIFPTALRLSRLLIPTLEKNIPCIPSILTYIIFNEPTNITPLLLESMLFASLDAHTPVDYVIFPSVALSKVAVTVNDKTHKSPQI